MSRLLSGSFSIVGFHATAPTSLFRRVNGTKEPEVHIPDAILFTNCPTGRKKCHRAQDFVTENHASPMTPPCCRGSVYFS